MNRFLLLLAATAVTLAACTKPEAADPEENTVEGTISFTLEPSLAYSAEGGAQTLYFNVDCPWTISFPEGVDWLSANPNHGDASPARKITLTVTARPNPDAEDRSSTLTIHAGSTQKDIPISQRGKVKVVEISEADVPNLDKIYIPQEFKSMNLFRSDSKWSFIRSRQSEHFIVFWDNGYDPYGEITPGDLPSGSTYFVDIDDLLEKAEEFFRVNVNVLLFADLNSGKSNLNKYKMGIYVHHTTEWMAYGGGYDNVIGSLWINPATCHPVGSTIAHEIGHSFQYQVYADAIANGAPNDFSTGWRYEIGQGCGFWEQCAQWQSYQSYAGEAFSTVNFTEFVNNCHRHFTHEHQRYASYFLMWHWASRYGVQEIGELWRLSKQPEDPIQTYQRKHGLSMEDLNADLYDYAARCVTWDFDAEATHLYSGQLTGITQSVREFGRDYIGKIGWTGNYDDASGFYTVDYSRAPEATGFNHIRLNVPESGSLQVRFEGLPNATGFNKVKNASIAGWHVGFVSLLDDGSRVYSPATRVLDSADISYDVPSGCHKLWMVVAATPQTYLQHLWDEDNSNDEQWPFRVQFTGTDLFGNLNFDGSETPQSITLEHNITTSAAAGYAGTAFTLDDDVIEIAKAFVMQPSDIVAAIPANRADVQKGTVKFAAVQPDGSLSYNYTANGYGFWYGADGSVQNWSAAYVYMEYDKGSWSCQFGVHPDKVSGGTIKADDVYTIRFAFVKGDVTATEVFHVTIVP